MAIEKNSVKVAVSRLDTEFSVAGTSSRESMSTDEDGICPRNSMDSDDDDDDDDDDEFDDADSGAGSDDFDLLELGEVGSEFCQVGHQTCCIPFELYDLPDLHGILSLEVWNECLTEDERFSLTKYLPDMDQEMFMCTLKELFEGGNFHFGNPTDSLYKMLKGGLCEPRVALYRQGLNFLQMHHHYHFLHKHQDSMVASFLQMREAWKNCKGYGIEEKLRVLNIMRSQKSLIGETNEGLNSDYSESEESAEAIGNLRSKGRSLGHVLSRGGGAAVDAIRGGKPISRLSMAGSKSPLQNELPQRFRYDLQSKKAGEQEMMYEMASQRDWNATQGNMMDQVEAMKRGKKREYDVESYSKTKFSGHEKNMSVNQLSDIKVLTSKPSDVRGFYDPSKRVKYGEPIFENQMEPVKGRMAQVGMKGNMGYHADVGEPYWGKKTQRQPYFPDPSFDYMGKGGETRKISLGKEVPNSGHRNPQALGNHLDSRMYLHDKRSKVFQDNIRGVIAQNQGSSMFPLKSERMFHGGEDTESDSSDQLEDGDKSHFTMPNRAMHGYFEAPLSSLTRPVVDKKEKRAMKSVKGNTLAFDGMLPAPSTMGDFGRHVHSQEITNYYLKSRQGGKTQYLDGLQNFTSKFPENGYYGDLGSTNAERNRMSAYILERNGQVQGLPVPVNNAFPFERRQQQNVGHELLARKSTHMRDYSMEENGVRFEGNPVRRGNRGIDATLIGCSSSGKKFKRKEGLAEMDDQIGFDYMQSHDPIFETLPLKNWGKKRQEDKGSPCPCPSEQPAAEVVVEILEPEIKPPKKPAPLITPTIHTSFSFSVIHLLSAVRVSLTTPNTEDFLEAQKHNENLAAEPEDKNAKHEQTNGSLEQIDVNIPADPEQASMNAAKPEQTSVNAAEPEQTIANAAQPEQTSANAAQREQTSANPAQREQTSVIPAQPEQTSAIPAQPEQTSANPAQPEQTIANPAQPELASANPEHPEQASANPAHPEQTSADPARPEQTSANPEIKPETSGALTVHGIVNRVRSNPGDPNILETQEPLQDLVRGVLKVFASKTAPLGAKGWKPLISYDKSTKCWSWTGPSPETPQDDEPPEEVTSPEAWGIPRKMLVKLVDSFANWLKCGQETLRQLGSLPAPPAQLMELKFDDKERFKDLRAQKSLPTFSPSSDEARAYFRKEEHLRYSIPDRAFSYTAADGKKSIVAPLRRCGGKPTSKARDHFMLKPDRPPHVTILCLVRDAAARLPGSIGTRADVCTLIRDSQYVVEDVSDAQVNQVISGALDRLHYERDPCVQFDGERKLWAYLHRDREEEDFEDDGTSSTKKWKRAKKDASEQDDQPTVDQPTVACPVNVEPTALEPISDLNAELPCKNDDMVVELMHDDTREVLKDGANSNHMPEQVAMLESGSQCLVNSKSEDFDDAIGQGEKHVQP